jgi:hypothetical protein
VQTILKGTSELQLDIKVDTLDLGQGWLVMS